MLVRDARDEDIGAIQTIYAHHVLHGTASFEEEAPSIEEMARRRADVLARGLPYLVAEDRRPRGRLQLCSPYRARPALSLLDRELRFTSSMDVRAAASDGRRWPR